MNKASTDYVRAVNKALEELRFLLESEPRRSVEFVAQEQYDIQHPEQYARDELVELCIAEECRIAWV